MGTGAGGRDGGFGVSYRPGVGVRVLARALLLVSLAVTAACASTAMPPAPASTVDASLECIEVFNDGPIR